MSSLDEFHPDVTISPDEYEPYIGHQRVEELKRLAAPLVGKSWANVNSTFTGGGVAEILQGVIPLARGLGVKARWFSIRGNIDFFKVTKKFHDMLQGVNGTISMEELFGTYLDTIKENAQGTIIDSDLVVIHDPQPVGLISAGVIFGNVIWRCHIDTSEPNRSIWRFLLPYINQCSGAIFTMPDFVGSGLQLPLYQIFPSIDPRAKKNHQTTEVEAQEILSPLFNESNIDPSRPILAAVSRYDIHKNQASIIKAFKKLKQEKKYKKPPYLIFLGNTAADDPSGGEMLKKLESLADEESDIKFWVNVQNNNAVVGALMSLAKGFIHVSTKEGFGLVVSEALWQGTPVLASNIGGIKRQVINGESGFLLHPKDIDTLADRMDYLLNNPSVATEMGAHGREHVRKSFLLPELMRKYLILMRYYTDIDRSLPDFRMNYLAYGEIIQSLRRRHPHLPDSTPMAA